MLQNYLTVALRNLWKNKVFTLINIFGLSTALACCILMFLFIQGELSYDKFNHNAANIYRVTSIADGTDGKTNLAVTPAPWAPLMKQNYPEIKTYVRLLKDEKSLVGLPKTEQHYEKNFIFCDSTFFNVFSVKLLRGDVHHALGKANSIILTKEIAAKYFGSKDPIGETIELNTSFGRSFTLQVTGISDEPAENSHFTFGALISMQTMGEINNFWSFHMFHSYLLLNQGISKAVLENKFKQFSEKYINNNVNADGRQEIQLQRLSDIHLYSHMVGEIGKNGDIAYLYVFSGITLFVLLIACFNFMNLSTVRSLQRAKEVGIRKVIGARRHQLTKQFLGESVLTAFLALILSLLLAVMLIPAFNRLSETSLSIHTINNYHFILISLFLILFVGVISGIYPALILSSFKSIEVLKGKFLKNVKGDLLRKGLVSFQFIISIALIASTIIVYRQLQFMQTKTLGFDREEVLVVTLPKNAGREKMEGLKNALLSNVKQISVAASSSIPGTQIAINQVQYENADPNKNLSMQMLFVDENFIQTMRMKIIAGRDFSKNYTTDLSEGFILNEEAIKQAGWKTPAQAINKIFKWVLPDRVLKSGKIIGVVKDFNITPLKGPVQPLVMHINPPRFQYLYVRYNDLTPRNEINLVQKKFGEFYTTQPFEYKFLDDSLNSMYATEARLNQLMEYFSGLAILISCMGIFGLSIYSIQQRVKEIGIRKVLGASTTNIVTELSKDFMKPVLIGSIIAVPIVWYAMNKWLQDFTYRIAISGWVFVVSGLAVLIITAATVGYQVIKAAIVNPAKSLKME